MRILNLLLLVPGLALGQSALLPTEEAPAEPTRAPLRTPLRAPKPSPPSPPPPRATAPLVEAPAPAAAPAAKTVSAAPAPAQRETVRAPVDAAPQRAGEAHVQQAVPASSAPTTASAQPAVMTPSVPAPSASTTPSRAPLRPGGAVQPASARAPLRPVAASTSPAATEATAQPANSATVPAATTGPEHAPSEVSVQADTSSPAPRPPASTNIRTPLATDAQRSESSVSPSTPGAPVPNRAASDSESSEGQLQTAGQGSAQEEVLLTPETVSTAPGTYDTMATPPPPGSAGANDPTYPIGSPYGAGAERGASPFGVLPPPTGPKPEIGLMISQTAFGALSAAGTALIPYLLFQKANALGTSDPMIANMVTLLAIAGTPLAVSSTQVGIANQSRFYFSDAWPSQLAGLGAQALVIGAFYLAGGFPVQGLAGFNRPNGELILLIGTLGVVPLASMAAINLTKMPRSVGYGGGYGALRVSPDGTVHAALPAPVPLMDATSPGRFAGVLVPLASGAF